MAGRDATKIFLAVGHSEDAIAARAEFLVGKLAAADAADAAAHAQNDPIVQDWERHAPTSVGTGDSGNGKENSKL